MNTNIFRIFSLLFICIGLYACSKNDTVTKTVIERLTQKPWKFQDAGFDGDRNGTVDQSDPYIQA